MVDQSMVYGVMEQYGFPASAVGEVRPLTLGTKGSSVRVQADGQYWVLKSHQQSGAPDRLRLAHAVEWRLAAEGFPVAPIQRSTAGATLAPVGDALYSLHRWVDGRHAAITDRDQVIDRRPLFLREFASFLARMHRVAGDLGGLEEEFPVQPVERRLQGPLRTVKAIRRIRPPRPAPWHMLRMKRDKTAFDRWIINAFPTIAQEAAELSRLAFSSPLHDAEIIVIHHDINWENIVFDADFGLRALIDFDHVTRAPRELEVGAAAVVLAGADPVRVEEFVSAYEEAARLPADRGAVALAMRLKCAQSISHTVRAHLEGDPDAADLRERWCHSLFASLQELTRR